MQTAVLHLISRFGIGGSERQFVERLRLHPEGYARHVGCLLKEGPLLAQLRSMEIDPIEFPLRGSLLRMNTLAQVGRIAEYVRQHRIGIVHATETESNLVGLLAARASGAKVIVSRGDLGHPRPAFGKWKRRAESICTSAADLVIANAEAVRDVCIREEFCTPSRVIVVPNGIDLGRFDALAAREPHPGFAADSGRITVAVIGNYWPVKCHRVLVEAAPRVREGIPNVRFVCAGDGSEREFLERRIDELDLRETVLLLGHRLDVPAVLARCDAACLCSSAEGLSNALMEAMAARLPAVATRVGGNPELIADGERGFLVPPGDAGALAEALIALLSDLPRARRMGEAGRAFVESRLTLERMRDAYAAAYQRALGGPPAELMARSAAA